MNKSVVLILIVLVFLAGAALTRLLMIAPAAPAEEPGPRSAAAAPPPPPAPDERASDLSEELARLRLEVAGLRKAIEPLQETDRTIRPLLAAKGEASPAGGSPSVRAEGVAGVADLLGLDSGRQAALVRTYEETMRKIRSAEERHATGKRDGRILAITVAPFPVEGKALVREWQQQLDALLTPEEREKYRKYSMEHSLFPMGLKQFGAQERAITITQSGDSYSLSESVSAGGGAGWTRSATGNESILAPYRHLIALAGGR